MERKAEEDRLDLERKMTTKVDWKMAEMEKKLAEELRDSERGQK